MSKSSNARRQIVWDAANKQVYENKAAEYKPKFKTVDDERFEKFYNKLRLSYIRIEAEYRSVASVYGHTFVDETPVKPKRNIG